MLTEALAALAGAGATAVIKAMATDAWRGARDGVAKLFRRGGDQGHGAVEQELDQDERAVAAAGPAEVDRVRQELTSVWTARLAQLLAEHPEVESELRVLVAQLVPDLAGASRSWVQTNIARDGSTQFAVQGGNVVYHAAPDKQVPAPDPETGSQ